MGCKLEMELKYSLKWILYIHVSHETGLSSAERKKKKKKKKEKVMKKKKKKERELSTNRC